VTIYAEDVNYLNTGKSNPDVWIERAKKEIRNISGKILQSGYAEQNGQAAFLLKFQIGDDTFDIKWQTLPGHYARTTELMRKRQAATLLFHDVKHRCVMAKIRGIRSTFLEYLTLPNGQTMGETVANVDQFKAILQNTPILLGTGEL